MKKIILFYPKPAHRGGYLVPLNLLAIARMLDSDKYKVIIINATIEKEYVKEVLNVAKGSLCVGITVMTGLQITDTLNVAKEVKKRFPKLPIILGGYHPTILPKQTVSHPCVDIVVKGQGEITFQKVVDKLGQNLPLNDVLGITFKSFDGKIIDNPNRSFVDLNEFPPLPWHLLDMEKYVRSRHPKYDGPSIDYYTSQGCPYSCKFCAENVFF